MTPNHNNQSVQNHSKHIFLIDDDESMRTVLKGMLEFLGFQVYVYASAIEFLKVSMQAAPAVIITDMQMPDMSGVELQAELLKRGRQIPIIFISGESSDQQIVKAFKNGAFDFLLKPFSREDFLSAVAKALEQDSIAMQEVIRKSQLAEALKTLSPRERQVFDLLAKGYGNKELVDELGIALSTAKEYKSEVMYKLRLRSLAELIALNSKLVLS
jgi:FixJ family two-component response regulator